MTAPDPTPPEVGCVTCGAAKGEPCIDTSIGFRRAVPWSHPMREAAAELAARLRERSQ